MARAGDLKELPMLNTRLHELMAQASGANLNRLITQMRSKIAWLYSIELPRRAEDSWLEHGMLVRAISRRDADRARDLMAAHIRSAATAYRLCKPDTAAEAPTF